MNSSYLDLNDHSIYGYENAQNLFSIANLVSSTIACGEIPPVHVTQFKFVEHLIADEVPAYMKESYLLVDVYLSNTPNGGHHRVAVAKCLGKKLPIISHKEIGDCISENNKELNKRISWRELKKPSLLSLNRDVAKYFNLCLFDHVYRSGMTQNELNLYKMVQGLDHHRKYDLLENHSLSKEVFDEAENRVFR